MTMIPDSHIDLLQRPILVTLVTLMPDGQPQATPVWADTVDGMVRINTAQQRQKDRNLTERPMATVLVIDPDNGQRYLEVRGEVASATTEDGDAVIDKLAHDYLGVDVYPFHTDAETRITYLIRPTHVTANG